MSWIDSIFSAVWDIATWFWNAATEVQDVWIVGSFFAKICKWIGDRFWDLLTPIAHFGDWATDVSNKVANILSSEGILGLIKSWFPWLEDIGNWFANIWTWLWTSIDTWWSTASTTVKDWISTATEGLAGLKVAWGNFFTVTLPTLFDLKYAELWWGGKLKDLGDLIDSKLKEWFPNYDTEAAQQPDRISFFAQPLDWLLNKFTDWFLGPEE